MKRPGTVLVTDADRGSALCIMRSLGRLGWRVVAAGHDRTSIGFRSRYVSERLVYPAPGQAPAEFVDAMLAAASRLHVDLIIPVTEATILPLHEERDRFRGISRFAMPDDEDAFRVVRDKSRTLELAASLGVPAPRSILATTPESARKAAKEIGWPVVLKPRFSRVYRNREKIDAFEVAYAASEVDLMQKLERFEGRSDVLVQEYCAGIGRGIGLLTDQGRPLAAFQHRRIHEVPITGGASSLRESEALDPELHEYSLRILEALRWTGLALVEFKIADTGPKLMEINGRVWGSLPLAVMSGVDFPRMLADLYRSDHPRPAIAPQHDYRAGVRARNLALDITWILATLTFKRRYPFLRAPSRRDGLIGILGLLDPRCRFDVQSLDDLGPGLAEFPEIARHLWQKVNPL